MLEVLVRQFLAAADMGFPVYFHFGPWRIHPHFVFETLAYTLAFRFYLYQRRRSGDVLHDADRWWMVAAAAMGAVAGSRLLYWFEDPQLTLRNWNNPAFIIGGKTILGALIGGLFAVEAAKKYLGITTRTGDLFAAPLCVGIAIGRVGCFLSGLDDHTTGIATRLPWGVNFGDGIARHPSSLYEAVFLVMLLAFLEWRAGQPHRQGDIFKAFMVAYLTFRFLGDFLKPDVRVIAGLSSIQCACLLVLFYYGRDIFRWITHEWVLTNQEGGAWTRN